MNKIILNSKIFLPVADEHWRMVVVVSESTFRLIMESGIDIVYEENGMITHLINLYFDNDNRNFKNHEFLTNADPSTICKIKLMDD